MSYADCLRRIATVAGRTLTDDEVRAVFERVHQAALDIKAGRVQPGGTVGGRIGKAIPGAESAIEAAAREAAARMEAEAALIERQANLQAIKIGARVADYKALTASGVSPIDAVTALIARDFSGKTNVESIEQKAMGTGDYFKSKILKTWDALGDDFLGLIQDKDKLLLLVRELRGEATGDAKAKAGAKAFHEAAEEARQTFNAAGGEVGRLDDWGMPQHHDQELVARAGRDAWVDTLLPLLDRARYVDDLGQVRDDAFMRQFLGKAWDTIATNGTINLEPGKMRGSGKKANQHGESRQIHFKDAQSVIDYWDQFGGQTVVEILTGHMDSMAKDIAFVESFGPNPNTTYQTLRDSAIKAAAEKVAAAGVDTEGLAEKAKAQAVKLDSLYNYAAGKTIPTYRQWLKSTADGIANLNVAGKLGGAALASLFGDKAMMEAVSHLNDLPMLDRWRTELGLLNPVNASERALLQQQGLMLDSVRSGLQRFYEGLGKSSTTGRLANAVMRVTGMQAINDIRKGAFGLSLMSAIGRQLDAGVTFANLTDSDVRTLRNFGIGEADWNIWKLAQLEKMPFGNDKTLTPESISRIPDADIARVMQLDVRAKQEAIGTKISELLGRNAKEDERLQARMVGIKEAEAKAAERLNKFMQTRDVRLSAAGDMFRTQVELMRAKVDRAELEADMNAYLLQEQARNASTETAIDAMRGRQPTEAKLAKSDAQGDRFSRQRGAIGEKLGERRGKTDQRVAELESRLKQMERDASAEIKAKYEELRGSIQDRIDDADVWYGESQNRIERREFVIDRLAGQASAVEAETVSAARRNAIVKLLGAVNTESEFAIVTPGWRERATFYGSLQRGTFPGEIWRSVLQFKAFPWAMFQRGMDAVANADAPTSKALMTAYLIASTTLGGAMLMQVREMLSGKDPRDMTGKGGAKPLDAMKFWGAAFLQGGALGIYGDFLYSVNQTRYGSGPLEAMAGPTIGPLLELAIVQPLTAAKNKIEGKDTHLMAQSFQDLKGFVPGGNIWYAKAALDHLVWQRVMEALSPGYLSTIRQKTQKEYGQQWWWNPGKTTPDRAPDLGRAIP